jgi:branched-subunit amino acid transport protein
MTGFVPILLVAVASLLMRQAFILFVPADRLPARVTSALDHLAPAVLAALVSVGTVEVFRTGGQPGGLASLIAVIAIAAVAYRRPSLTLSAGLGAAAVLAIDLVLV